MPFNLKCEYSPAGDQPKAISELTQLLNNKSEYHKYQTLLGVTGSGKTYTVANVIQNTQKPSLIIAPNKSLAAQLFNEFKEFFPDNAVEFFISYYDYYQPESYIPSTDTYIEKTAKINQEIDRLRHSATRAIFERDDVIVVSSVSAIYGLGAPDSYFQASIKLCKGLPMGRDSLAQALIDIYFERNDFELDRGRFRMRGDCVDVFPTYEEVLIRIEFFGDEIDRISTIELGSGRVLEELEEITVYPAKHYVADTESIAGACAEIDRQLQIRLAELKSIDKHLEAARLNQRTCYDIEMLREVGYCNGIENYSSILEGRAPGTPPQTLIDYFVKRFGHNWLTVIDESHIATPQLQGMYNGDASRKQTLVDYGFRLPCARDNRPLKIAEFWERTGPILFVSATPGDYERKHSHKIVEQVIRPTGLVDPQIHIHPTKHQIDDLIVRIRERVEKQERVLITTLTKKSAEDLSDYLIGINVRARWLHSELKSLERVELLRDLRMGEFDVLIGVNLLREGLDLPEVSLVVILDADKEGFLRSKSALIQIIGRAARNSCGEVVLYADKVTDSMQQALDTINDYRSRQVAFNEEHGIVPQTIKKSFSNKLLEALKLTSKNAEEIIAEELAEQNLGIKDIPKVIKKLEEEMLHAAKDLEFERAGALRDQIKKFREVMGKEITQISEKNLEKSKTTKPTKLKAGKAI
ncbi:MAG: excinuclease ABC subunit UvrB [Candidatus Caenarcaniphilales bacterium]|nr:excinuclease ABC subunit UvrB [Candidatus Caenarcaniphilales bacterium]